MELFPPVLGSHIFYFAVMCKKNQSFSSPEVNTFQWEKPIWGLEKQPILVETMTLQTKASIF